MFLSSTPRGWLGSQPRRGFFDPLDRFGAPVVNGRVGLGPGHGEADKVFVTLERRDHGGGHALVGDELIDGFIAPEDVRGAKSLITWRARRD